jgi:HEAT repeat protein
MPFPTPLAGSRGGRGTLGKLKLTGAVEHLVAVMDDRYWQVRVRAARSLGRLKAAAALPALRRRSRTKISNLRKEAAIAWESWATPRRSPRWSRR